MNTQTTSDSSDLFADVEHRAKNLSLDHIKRAESRLTDGVDEIDSIQPSELDSTYAQEVSDEEFVLFCEAVRELPKQSRRAFILKKVYGYTLKEIMVEMGLGQATVETHIVNGTKKCVQYMRDRQEQPAGRHLTSRNSNAGSSRRRPGGEL